MTEMITEMGALLQSAKHVTQTQVWPLGRRALLMASRLGTRHQRVLALTLIGAAEEVACVQQQLEQEDPRLSLGAGAGWMQGDCRRGVCSLRWKLSVDS